MKYVQHIKFSVTITVGNKTEIMMKSTLSFGDEDALDACLKKFFDEIVESGSIIVYDDITRNEDSYELSLKNTDVKDERYAEATVKLELMYVQEMKVGE